MSDGDADATPDAATARGHRRRRRRLTANAAGERRRRAVGAVRSPAHAVAVAHRWSASRRARRTPTGRAADADDDHDTGRMPHRRWAHRRRSDRQDRRSTAGRPRHHHAAPETEPATNLNPPTAHRRAGQRIRRLRAVGLLGIRLRAPRPGGRPTSSRRRRGRRRADRP